MDNTNKVLEFCLLANRLKNKIRQGWLDWSINRDRVESDIQCKIYDLEGCVDVNNGFKDPYLENYYDKGMSWSEMWCRANRERCKYDENFMEVSNAIINKN